MEVDGDDPAASLESHIAGDRGVDPARKHQSHPPARSHRQPSGAGQPTKGENDSAAEYLYPDHQLCSFEPHGPAGSLLNRRAQHALDLGRDEGKRLVVAGGADAEGFDRSGGQKLQEGAASGIDIWRSKVSQAKVGDAKDCVQRLFPARLVERPVQANQHPPR